MTSFEDLVSLYVDVVNTHREADHVSIFYAFLGTSTLLTTVLLSAVSQGNNFHSRVNKAVLVTTPSWLPTIFLRWLNRYATFYLANLVPLVAGVAAVNPTPLAKVVVAVLYGFYALAESSVTNSHRDYANTYTCLCIAFLPQHYVEPMALALCIHYLSSAGFAKILIGGRQWGSGKSLGSIIEPYTKLTIAEGGPGVNILSRFLQRSPSLCMLMSSGTLVFEVLLVPVAFALPLEARVLLVPVSMGFHFGIAIAQSFTIGLCFMTNIATYVFAFGANIEILSEPWWAGVVLYICIEGYVFISGRFIAEDWPLTPFALFPWAYEQNAFLTGHFVNGETRLVIGTEEYAKKQLIGVMPLEKFDRDKVKRDSSIRVYDAWEQVVGETIMYNAMLDNLRTLRSSKDTERFVKATTQWLATTRRIAEIDSGLVVCQAWFVKVDKQGRIVQVIH